MSEEKSITDALYKDYSAFKRELFADICNRNAGVADKLTLFRKTQKLLDRLLFIFLSYKGSLRDEVKPVALT